MDPRIYFITIEASDKEPIKDPAVLFDMTACLSENFLLYASRAIIYT
jgi:hypothetical protein